MPAVLKNNATPWTSSAVRSEYRELGNLSTPGVTHQGTNPPTAAYRGLLENREASMRQAKTVLAACMLTIISSATLAQQALTGTVATIDRINGTIGIQQTPNGTVGASAGAATEQFKVQGSLVDKFHAGDKVTYSVTGTGGAKTITAIDRQ
jgi:copper binding protein CusF